MGRPKLTLYSLVIQLPDPLFKHYHPAIRPVCSPQSPVTKCTKCFSAWGICGLHPPGTFNNALTKALPARGGPAQDALSRTPLWWTMMKVSPSGNGPRDARQADANDAG
ncbi:hypothetical protein O181_053306 [Austropuccinia psidii MF-1]|uniref:Uncharacterized protein n=1 Tax=Austropuccinia psidii MF-1 TaxID=1389203 RepID=A0A9Q3E791_9BASI|nr:hypothetical protein [Austropuccinia psidii MF-1]